MGAYPICGYTHTLIGTPGHSLITHSLMLVSHYRESPADPLRIPLELEHTLGASSGDSQGIHRQSSGNPQGIHSSSMTLA